MLVISLYVELSQSEFLNDMKQLLTDHTLSDFEVVVEGQSFFGHLVVFGTFIVLRF